jgi:hypothetical protein
MVRRRVHSPWELESVSTGSYCSKIKCTPLVGTPIAQNPPANAVVRLGDISWDGWTVRRGAGEEN